MDRWIHPAIFFFIGALILPLFRGKAKKFVVLLIPALSIIDVALMMEGVYGSYSFLNANIIFGRVDKLSLVFAWVFTIMGFLGSIYALHVEEDGHQPGGSLVVGNLSRAEPPDELLHLIGGVDAAVPLLFDE